MYNGEHDPSQNKKVIFFVIFGKTNKSLSFFLGTLSNLMLMFA